jgi:hypothetical protein
VVRKFTLETRKLMHSLCPIDRANKSYNAKAAPKTCCLELD